MLISDPTEQANLARFARLVAQPDPAIDLATGALCAAAAGGRAVDFEHALAQIDSLAERARMRIEIGDDMARVVGSIHDVVYVQTGFRPPAAAEFHDPRNSLLDAVLDRRVGLPLSLAIVELEVAWRLGAPLHGVALPGHFLVGGPDGGVTDPADAGRRLTPDDCQALLRQAVGDRLLFHASMLRPASRRDMLARLLRNLRAAYLGERNWLPTYRIVDLLATLEPTVAEHARDRGMLLGRLGRFSDALVNLTHYLDVAPGASDADDVRRVMAIFKGRRN